MVIFDTPFPRAVPTTNCETQAARRPDNVCEELRPGLPGPLPLLASAAVEHRHRLDYRYRAGEENQGCVRGKTAFPPTAPAIVPTTIRGVMSHRVACRVPLILLITPVLGGGAGPALRLVDPQPARRWTCAAVWCKKPSSKRRLKFSPERTVISMAPAAPRLSKICPKERSRVV